MADETLVNLWVSVKWFPKCEARSEKIVFLHSYFSTTTVEKHDKVLKYSVAGDSVIWTKKKN